MGLASTENDRKENKIILLSVAWHFFFFFLANENLETVKLKERPYICVCWKYTRQMALLRGTRPQLGFAQHNSLGYRLFYCSVKEKEPYRIGEAPDLLVHLILWSRFWRSQLGHISLACKWMILLGCFMITSPVFLIWGVLHGNFKSCWHLWNDIGSYNLFSLGEH